MRSMSAALAVPHFHFHDELCVDALLRTRRALAGDPALGGAKLTLLPLAITVGVRGVRGGGREAPGQLQCRVALERSLGCLLEGLLAA